MNSWLRGFLPNSHPFRRLFHYFYRKNPNIRDLKKKWLIPLRVELTEQRKKIGARKKHKRNQIRIFKKKLCLRDVDKIAHTDLFSLLARFSSKVNRSVMKTNVKEGPGKTAWRRESVTTKAWLKHPVLAPTPFIQPLSTPYRVTRHCQQHCWRDPNQRPTSKSGIKLRLTMIRSRPSPTPFPKWRDLFGSVIVFNALENKIVWWLFLPEMQGGVTGEKIQPKKYYIGSRNTGENSNKIAVR